MSCKNCEHCESCTRKHEVEVTQIEKDTCRHEGNIVDCYTIFMEDTQGEDWEYWVPVSLVKRLPKEGDIFKSTSAVEAFVTSE